jgi:hypothetical protein
MPQYGEYTVFNALIPSQLSELINTLTMRKRLEARFLLRANVSLIEAIPYLCYCNAVDESSGH